MPGSPGSGRIFINIGFVCSTIYLLYKLFAFEVQSLSLWYTLDKANKVRKKDCHLSICRCIHDWGSCVYASVIILLSRARALLCASCVLSEGTQGAVLTCAVQSGPWLPLVWCCTGSGQCPGLDSDGMSAVDHAACRSFSRLTHQSKR